MNFVLHILNGLVLASSLGMMNFLSISLFALLLLNLEGIEVACLFVLEMLGKTFFLAHRYIGYFAIVSIPALEFVYGVSIFIPLSSPLFFSN